MFLPRLFYRFALAAVVFAMSAGAAFAQSVTTLPLAQSSFCAGETITVNYAVTGSFVPGNAFILQLSGPDGGFTDRFTNLASVSSTASGSISAKIPEDLPASDRYRFRVIGSNPLIEGSDNGSDIALGKKPSFEIPVMWTAVEDAPFYPRIYVRDARFLNWHFGNDATPVSISHFEPTVIYASPGVKSIIVAAVGMGDCITSKVGSVNVMPRNPTIPASATIVTGNVILENITLPSGQSFWICPGGSLEIRGDVAGQFTTYIEAGGAFVADKGYLNSGNVYYIRKGGSIIGNNRLEGWLVYEEGAGVTVDSHIRRAKVSSITFDYSQVPTGGCPSLAPYTVQVKPDVRSIAVPEQDIRSESEYYITAAGSLTSYGSHNAYYLEPGASLDVGGDSSTIYVKAGATATVMAGRGHRIIYELGADVSSPGEDAVLLPSSGITYEGRVSGVGVTEAPESMVRVSPNPVSERMNVAIDDRLGRVENIRVFDERGRELIVLTKTSREISVDVASWPVGNYFMQVKTDRGEYVRAFVVR